MERAVSALASIGTGERDVVPVWRPAYLIALQFHILNETFSVVGILQSLVDSLNEIQFPTVATQTGLILAGLHPLLFSLLVRLLQHIQTMGETDLIVHLSVHQQIAVTLVELVAILEADAVDHQMVVQMARVNVGGNYHLEVWELPLRKFQTDGIDLLWCKIIIRREGLDEVVELSVRP